MEEKTNTEPAGAVPADKGKEPESLTGKAAEVKEEKSDSSPEEKLPFDQHPKWKEARSAAKKLNDLLKANEVDDPDDLSELIQKGKAVRGKLADLNQLDTIIEKAARLEKYEEYWATEEERKRRGNEDPEQTIARLENQLKSKSAAEKQREFERQQAERAKQAINNYDREVKDLIRDMEIPKEQSPFVMKLCGVNNPFNDIDITDRKAIKKTVSELIREKESYDQEVIRNYLRGKGEIPKVGSASSGAPETDKPKINMKSARAMFKESVGKAFSGG